MLGEVSKLRYASRRSFSPIRVLQTSMATIQPAVLQRLSQQIEAMRQRILKLGITEDAFHDWFDDQLFKTSHSAPEDYCDELQMNVRQLNRTANPQHQQWLAARIEQQMLALHRAVAYFQGKA